MNVGDIDHVLSIDAAAVPREEAVARAARQPAHVAKAASESKPHAQSPASSAESEKGHIRGRPDRIVSAVNRPRPPAPIPAIDEPASIVIWSPAPGLVGNPCPAIVRFIHPTAVAIRRPTRGFRGKPDTPIVGNVAPLTIGVQILRARVVGIGVLPASRAFYRVIAVAVPFVPIVPPGRSRNLVLCII